MRYRRTATATATTPYVPDAIAALSARSFVRARGGGHLLRSSLHSRGAVGGALQTPTCHRSSRAGWPTWRLWSAAWAASSWTKAWVCRSVSASCFRFGESAHQRQRMRCWQARAPSCAPGAACELHAPRLQLTCRTLRIAIDDPSALCRHEVAFALGQMQVRRLVHPLRRAH